MSNAGRPTLVIPLEVILESVRRTGYIRQSALELECSEGYIRMRLKAVEINLHELLADALTITPVNDASNSQSAFRSAETGSSGAF